MNYLICGSRNWTDKASIEKYIRRLWKLENLIAGEAVGVDSIVREVAHKRKIPIIDSHCNWVEKEDEIAVFKALLRDNPDVVVVFHENLSKSRGTANMIKQAHDIGIPVVIVSS